MPEAFERERETIESCAKIVLAGVSELVVGDDGPCPSGKYRSRWCRCFPESVRVQSLAKDILWRGMYEAQLEPV